MNLNFFGEYGESPLFNLKEQPKELTNLFGYRSLSNFDDYNMMNLDGMWVAPTDADGVQLTNLRRPKDQWVPPPGREDAGQGKRSDRDLSNFPEEPLL